MFDPLICLASSQVHWNGNFCVSECNNFIQMQPISRINARLTPQRQIPSIQRQVPLTLRPLAGRKSWQKFSRTNLFFLGAMGWEWGVGAMLDQSGMSEMPFGMPYMPMPRGHGLAWSRQMPLAFALPWAPLIGCSHNHLPSDIVL